LTAIPACEPACRNGDCGRLRSIKRFLFAVLSRSGVAIYSRLPIFGPLRAAVAVIRKGELVLVIDRSDGRGFSLPGGLAYPWETAEQAMRREVLEETGLAIEKCRLLCEYQSSPEKSSPDKSSADISCIIAAFEAQASGALAESWEGSPRWLASAEIRPHILPSQIEIIDRIR
jgi:8-oxo-dGTP diphosphatase